MRVLNVLAFSLMAFMFSLAPVFAQDTSGSAPADEYFGRQKMSILEIRNRLHAFEQKTDAEITADPNRNVGIDSIEDATMDWLAHYPHDSWLPDALDRLVHAYQRADATSTSAAVTVVGTLLTRFPQTPAAKDAIVALVGDTVSAPAAVSVTGRVVDTAGNPIAGALVLAAAGQESADPQKAVFAVTTADGAFSLANLGPGSIFLRVEPPHGAALEIGHMTVDATQAVNDAGQIVLAAPQAAASPDPAASSTP